jgi:hypothetical protein
MRVVACMRAGRKVPVVALGFKKEMRPDRLGTG